MTAHGALVVTTRSVEGAFTAPLQAAVEALASQPIRLRNDITA